MEKNLYDILAINQDVSAEEIKKSYRRLSKQYHPDLNPDNKIAEVRFKEINEAYAVLGNKKLRQAYNEKLAATLERKQKVCEKSQQQTKPSQNSAFDNVNQQFERFFGFHPESKEINNHFGSKNKSQGKNPLDTSHIFDNFFNPKKK